MSIRQRLLLWAITYTEAHKCDEDIGKAQLQRWHLFRIKIFGWKVFGLYLHKFNRSDDYRACHDHPSASLGWILGPGGYGEVIRHKSGEEVICNRYLGSWTFRSAKFSHRVIIYGTPIFTLFLVGPTWHHWGFWCPQGWRKHEDFIHRTPGANDIGRGCGDL